MQKNHFIFLDFLFIVLLLVSCASNRNNGIGTGDAGNAHIEAVASTGKVENGIEGVGRSADEITGNLAASAGYQQTAITGNSNAQSGIAEATTICLQISDILRAIRDRESAKGSGIENKNPYLE